MTNNRKSRIPILNPLLNLQRSRGTATINIPKYGDARTGVGHRSDMALEIFYKYQSVSRQIFPIGVRQGGQVVGTGGLVLGLMSQAKQRSHVAGYITTALCAGTFTCAAALIDVRLCINTDPPSRENPSCVLFNVSDTNAARVHIGWATSTRRKHPIDRKTGKWTRSHRSKAHRLYRDNLFRSPTRSHIT